MKYHHIPSNLVSTFKKVLNNEVNILLSIKHPNILRLVEHNTVDGELVQKKGGKLIHIFFIVLELVE